MAPSVWRPVGVRATQDGDEVDFEHLDGPFCKVPSVHVCVDKLAVKVFCFDACHEII